MSDDYVDSWRWPDSGIYSPPFSDFYPYNKWQTAKFALDVGLMFTPLAVISGIRKAKYIRGLMQAVQRSRQGKKIVAVEKYMVERPIRSTLFLGGTAGGYAVSPLSPIYPQIIMTRTVADVFIAYYLDKEGQISSFIPSDQFIRDYHESIGEDSLLTSRTGTPGKSFYDMDGLSALNTIRGSTPELPSFEIGRGSGPRRNRQKADSGKSDSHTPSGVRSRNARRRPGRTRRPWEYYSRLRIRRRR